MTAVIDVIASSLRIIGSASLGETIGAAKLANGLSAMNQMLGGWSAQPNSLYFVTEDTHTLVASTGSYTIGSGGDIDTTRPIKILNAFVRDSTSDYSLELIDRAKYDSIVAKGSTGFPQYLYYEPSMPTGTIYLYPEPSSAYELHIKSLKPFSSSYAATDTFALPPGYEEAIKFNLAIRLAPEYGRAVTQEVVALAVSTLNFIKTQNSATRVKQIRSNPFGGGFNEDIESDS